MAAPRPLRAVALAALLAACGSPSDTGSSGGDPADSSGSAEGIIFKGPMARGGRVLVQPLSGDLQMLGEPVEVEVADDGGSYTVELDHQGLVRITAEGEAFNEAWGDRREGEQIELVAYGEVGDRTSLHVNLLTHLIAPALEERLQAGSPFTLAQDQLLAELYQALPYEGRPEPGARGPEINPFGDGFAQAWLFGFSGIVAEASRGYGPPGAEPADGFDLPAFLDELSEGFAADGALPADALELLRLAEPAFNPDLAMLGLQRLIDESALDAQVPDLHRFLDTDLDGLLNADDNCRYAPNPDQAPAPEGPHGAACDSRLAAVSATDQWGCGVLAADSAAGPAGGVVCWEVRGAETGGSPPLPDVFPAAQRAPWGDDSPFAGADGDAPAFTAVAVASRGEAAPWVCAALDAGGAVCWDAEAPAAPRPLPELTAPLLLSAERVCGASAAGGGVSCAARAGGGAPGFVGEVLDFAIAGDDHLCVVDAAGALRCQDGAGVELALPSWADAGVAAVGGNTAGGEPFACAVLAADGSVRCVDLDPTSGLAAPPPAPAGAGYADVSVGLGTACAWTEAGALGCGRFEADAPEVLAGDAVACPAWSPPPERAWKISMGACYACGVDGAGFGACWPDDWSRARGEGEPIGG